MPSPPRLRQGALLAIVLVAIAGYALNRTKRDFYDFEVYRTAAIRATAGEDLYRPEDGHYQYKYWPAFALAMAPFGWMPPEVGRICWYVLSVYLLVLFFTRAIAQLPGRRSSVRLLVWCGLLLTVKFIVKELANGQTNVLFAVVLLFGLAALQTGQRLWAGAFVALATFIKPYALIFLPWLALTQPLAVTTASVGVMAAGLVLPAAIYGWHGNLALLADWYSTVSETTAPNLSFPENISFAAMWGKWIGIGSLASHLATATSVLAMGAAVALWARRRGVTSPAYLELGFLLLLIPLVSPQGWDYVLLIALPAMLCLVDRFGDGTSAWRVLVLAGFGLTSLTIFDLLGRSLYTWLMHISGVSIGAMLLAAALVRLRFRALA